MDRRRDIIVGLIHLTSGACLLLLVTVADFKPFDFIAAHSIASDTVTFIAAFAEALYLIGSYVPGSTVIIAALVSTSCRSQETAIMVGLIWSGAVLGLLFDILLGLAVRRRLPLKPDKSSPKFWKPWFVAFHPNAAAIYVFHRSATSPLKFSEFAAVALSGLLFVLLYALMLCHAGVFLEGAQKDLSIFWSLVLITLGVAQLFVRS